MQGHEIIPAIFAIFAIFIALPWMLLHYLGRRRGGAAPAADPAMSGTLLTIAEKLERRLDAIETILDHEMPGWRRGMDRRP